MLYIVYCLYIYIYIYVEIYIYIFDITKKHKTNTKTFKIRMITYFTNSNLKASIYVYAVVYIL